MTAACLSCLTEWSLVSIVLSGLLAGLTAAVVKQTLDLWRARRRIERMGRVICWNRRSRIWRTHV